jgi:hypothetical protein
MGNEIKNMRLVQIDDEKHCRFVEYVPSEELNESMQILISDEDRLAIGFTKCFDLETLEIVDYDNTINKIIEHNNVLRARRQSICFPIINRGQLWYDTLSKSQKEELQVWYKAWLDVTKTLEEPAVPEFLLKELERFYIVREEPVIEPMPEIEEIVEDQINDEITEEIIIEEPIEKNVATEENIQYEETTEQEVTEDEEI